MKPLPMLWCSLALLGACGRDVSLAIPAPDARAELVVGSHDGLDHPRVPAPIAIGAVDFGVVASDASATATAAVSNLTDHAVELGAVTVDAPAFVVVATACGGALAPGASCEVRVTFTPRAIGDDAGALAVVAAGAAIAGELHGTGGGWVEVAKAGAGDGIVGSDALGISCGDACAGVFAAPVVLRVRPRPGSTFVGWSGACKGGGECVITPQLDPVGVTATFGP